MQASIPLVSGSRPSIFFRRVSQHLTEDHWNMKDQDQPRPPKLENSIQIVPERKKTYKILISPTTTTTKQL